MLVKVCGLRDTDNLSKIVSLGPDYIGLIFYPSSKRYVGNEKMLGPFVKNISSVKKVGVFVNADYKTILKAVAEFGLDYLQLHGEESADYCAVLSGHVKIIKAFAVSEDFRFEKLAAYERHCSHFLFDTATSLYGGSGKVFNWHMLQQYHMPTAYFLSGGISPENIQQVKMINDPRLIGVDVNSCFEKAPGIKDVHKVKKFIHELRSK